MHFIQDYKLAARLRDKLVDQKEQAFYLLMGGVMTTFFMTSTYNHPVYSAIESLNIYDKLLDILYFITVGLMIYVSYAANKKGDGQDFIKRYICINFPVFIQMMILTILLGSVTIILDNPRYLTPDYDAFSDTQSGAGIYGIAGYCVTSAYGIWRMHNGFKIASGQREYSL